MTAEDKDCDVVEGTSSGCCNVDIVGESIFDGDIGSIESEDPFGPFRWDGLESFYVLVGESDSLVSYMRHDDLPGTVKGIPS